MITALRLHDFKNFVSETLQIGPFTVIVGVNASGKSNLRDAFRFLHGIGRGYSLAEIIGGKYGAGGQIEWAPIRGAINEITRWGTSAFSIEVDLQMHKGKSATYCIKVGYNKENPGDFRVEHEELRLQRDTIYTSYPPEPDPVRKQDDDAHLLLRMAKTGTQRKYGNKVAVRWDRPALSQIQDIKPVMRVHKDCVRQVLDLLGHWRFLEPMPDLMRQPAFPGQTVLGDRGENLATVLQQIHADEHRREILFQWIRDLTPMDVVDLEFRSDPTTSLVNLVIHEADGNSTSAYSASDGTLRFLSMLAALLDKGRAHLYVFEEIDNGTHPARLHLLIDLIEQQTAGNAVQVVTTTHSPELLSMVNDSTFDKMSVVCRLENTENAIVRPVSQLPNARKIRKSQGLGRLLSGGWMEDALAFTEISDEAADR